MNIKFKKSSFSFDREAGQRCVEVAMSSDVVLVRHSNRKSDRLVFTIEEWEAFVQGVKANEFDTKEA